LVVLSIKAICITHLKHCNFQAQTSLQDSFVLEERIAC
jgi:hypothetical protein